MADTTASTQKATGELNSLEDFVVIAFREVGLDWRKHVELDPAFRRPTELAGGSGDPSLAASNLGWKAKYRMRDVVRMMVLGERALAAGETVQVLQTTSSEKGQATADRGLA